MLYLPRSLLPSRVRSAFIVESKVLLPYFAKLRKQIDTIRRTEKSDGSAPSIIGELLDSDLPDSVKSTRHLEVESRQLLAAGTNTTARTLTSTCYHLLANPDKLQKLKAELVIAIPNTDDIPPCAELEALPYLKAVIQEALRIDSPVVFTMERIAPDEDLLYSSKRDGKTYTIRKGTTMGMTNPILSRDETYHDSPDVFRPERFIDNPDLEKRQMPFGRGTRRFLGENLANSEIYLTIALLFRKYDFYKGNDDGTSGGMEEAKGPTLELYQTDRADLEMASSIVIPFPAKAKKGVRLRVHH